MSKTRASLLGGARVGVHTGVAAPSEHTQNLGVFSAFMERGPLCLVRPVILAFLAGDQVVEL